MFSEIFENLYSMTAFSAIADNPLFLVMYLLAFVLLYLPTPGIQAKAALSNRAHRENLLIIQAVPGCQPPWLCTCVR